MTPKDDAQDDELLARYRRASDTDAAAPSESVRSAILAESRRVADELAKKQHPFDVSRPAANDARWKITAFGTVGAALLAALLIAPRFWESQRAKEVSRTEVSSAPAAASARLREQAPAVVSAPVDALATAAAPPAAPVDAPAAKTAFAADAASSAPKRESVAPSRPGESLQEIVVTQAERKTSKASAEESRRYSAPAPSNAPSVVQNYAHAPPSQPQVSNSLVRPVTPATKDATTLLSGGAVQGDALLGADRAARASTVPTPSSLQAAAGLGDVRQSATLLDQGVAVDAREQDGRTPLMLAVVQGRLEVVRLLLARGADPNAADNAGQTPLQQARDKNLRDIAALLERAGAH